jgi:Zn-dependent M28 family amino/carboxypeptidase
MADIPENASLTRKQYLRRFSSLREKARQARDRGAKGLIVVHGPNAGVSDQLVPLKIDASAAAMSLAGISVSDSAAERFLAGSGKTLKQLQDELDQGDLSQGFELSVKISGRVQVIQEKRVGRNVLARLRAGDAFSETSQSTGRARIESMILRPSVLIGAHVDHLGDDGDGRIHVGADDNASGVASVLEIAQLLVHSIKKGSSLKHDVIFALWSGEELGLLGSSHFARSLATANSGQIYPQMAAALNLDMVGRLRESLTLQSVAASPAWPALIEQAAARTKISVTMMADPYLPTDSTSFYLQGVPTLNAFTGSHDDYHTPGDTWEKLNYQGMEKIAGLMSDILIEVASNPGAPPFNPVKDPNSGGGSGGGFKAYLGTIPDYSDTSAKGVLLSGVKAGSPAEASGVRAGDIIVSLAGQKIENIYDYTNVLGVLKIGQAVIIEVQRGAERLSFSVTPGSRG